MKYVIYGHGGSRNHGCEAIIRTTLNMLGDSIPIEVYSSDLEGDKKYGVYSTGQAVFHPYRDKSSSKIGHLYYSAMYRLFKNYDPMTRFELGDALKEKGDIFISVGGDNYCNGHPGKHISRNRLFSKNNKTVLWGCSVTPELFKSRSLVDDMNRYSLITARESLTCNAIKEAGVRSKTVLLPDPAFTLPVEEIPFPKGFIPGNTVGINVSPLVTSLEQSDNILYKNICALIEDILKNSDMNVALIPHVVWDHNDDLTVLRQLYAKYSGTGRVILVDPDKQMNCMQLKYIISNCRYMVTARTHASIASYSTQVPTLVIGYSVKSRGIATDLFGTADNYVVPVNNIDSEERIKTAFTWLCDHEAQVKEKLAEVMPAYIERAYTAGDLIKELR